MKLNKEYKKIEEDLAKKYTDNALPIITLIEDDFDEGVLSPNGYDKIKNQCKYINKMHEVTIKAPKKYETIFKESLEKRAANELRDIRKERKVTEWTAIILMIIGSIIFGVAQFMTMEWHMKATAVFIQVVGMTSYIFVWTAIEKWFFDRTTIRIDRVRILKIITSTIEYY